MRLQAACKPPPKHGPYHQPSHTPKPRNRTTPAHPVHPAPLRAQRPKYQKLPALLDQLPEASIDPDRLRHGDGKPNATVTNHAREALTPNPHPPIHPHTLGSAETL